MINVRGQLYVTTNKFRRQTKYIASNFVLPEDSMSIWKSATSTTMIERRPIRE